MNDPIVNANLSVAWSELFRRAMASPRKCLPPTLLQLTDLDGSLPLEHTSVRQLVDDALRSNDKYTCAKTALTIFPYNYWNRTKATCGELSKWYLEEFYPRVRALNSHNCHGTYFQRMLEFQGVKLVKGKPTIHSVNQLEYIIEFWNRARAKDKHPRNSALQISCLDPAKDDNYSALSGFPCLQQVSIAYIGNDRITLNAYYPTQYIFDRAYGNYLGLCQLGLFLAKEMHVTLDSFNCFIACPQLGDVSKKQLAVLANLLASSQTPATAIP